MNSVVEMGFMTTDSASLRGWVEGADAAGLHVIVHAIGDRAIDWLLDVYRDVESANGPRDRRFRQTHPVSPGRGGTGHRQRARVIYPL